MCTMHSGYESFSRPQPKAMDRVRRDTLALGSHGGHQTSVDMLLAAEEEAMVRAAQRARRPTQRSRAGQLT